MTAREKLLAIVEKGNYGPNVMDFCDGIVELVKEELCSGSQKWEIITDFAEKKEPELIQGYTAEQWQEIIDGGYLCEFEGSGNESIGFLEEIKGGGYPFQQIDGSDWTNCRPAQIKGALSLIWVKPVDNPYCVFLNEDGHVSGYGEWRLFHTNKDNAKYMEI